MSHNTKIICFLAITCALGIYYFLISEKVKINRTDSPSLSAPIADDSQIIAIVPVITPSTKAMSNNDVSEDTSSSTTISNRRTIFFLETTNKTNLNCRQSCAIESAAKTNPNMDVTLFHISPELNFSNTLIKLLSEMANVKLKYLNTKTFFDGSPLQSWNLAGKWKQSPYKIHHVSDAVRLLVLWKFGGIYLDSDVVVMKSLKDLVNCSGLEDKVEVANGVLAFDKHHPFLFQCLQEFNATYDKDAWSQNGPLLLKRVLMRECIDVSKLLDVSREKCNGVMLFPPQAFYAIGFRDWKLFFNSKNATNTMKQWENSYLIHVWNKFSAGATITLGSGQPYELAAIKYCPEIHEMCQKNGSF